MGEAFEIRTARLRIRSWRDEDIEPHAAMNADPRVMEFFPSVMSREESTAALARARERIAERGFSFWPVEVVGGASFIGMVGLSVPSFEAPFMPAVEIGWRLAADHWGQGYATEAARAVLAHGFDRLGLPEIVAFTTAANARSRRVMEKLGMRHDARGRLPPPGDPGGHPQRPHVLYRLARAAFDPGRVTPLRGSRCRRHPPISPHAFCDPLLPLRRSLSLSPRRCRWRPASTASTCTGR